MPQKAAKGRQGSRFRRRLLHIAIASLCVVGFAGCAQSNSKPQTPSSPPSAAVPAKTQSEMKIKLYFGDTDLSKLQIREKTIRFSEPEEKYRLALQGLQDKPENGLVSLFQSMTFTSVNFREGQLTVDLKIAPGGQFGAPGEELTVEALTQVLFQFDEVKSIDILKDGQPVESLMGHVELPHPIRR